MSEGNLTVNPSHHSYTKSLFNPSPSPSSSSKNGFLSPQKDCVCNGKLPLKDKNDFRKIHDARQYNFTGKGSTLPGFVTENGNTLVNGDGVGKKFEDGSSINGNRQGCRVQLPGCNLSNRDKIAGGFSVNRDGLGLSGGYTFTSLGLSGIAGIFGWDWSDIKIKPGSDPEMHKVEVNHITNVGLVGALSQNIPAFLVGIPGFFKPEINAKQHTKRTLRFEQSKKDTEALLCQQDTTVGQYLRQRVFGPNLQDMGMILPSLKNPESFKEGQTFTCLTNQTVTGRAVVGSGGIFDSKSIPVPGRIGGERQTTCQIEYTITRMPNNRLEVGTKSKGATSGRLFATVLGIEGGWAQDTSVEVEYQFLIRDITTPEGQENFKKLVGGALWCLNEEEKPEWSKYCSQGSYLHTYASIINKHIMTKGIICTSIRQTENKVQCHGIGFALHLPFMLRPIFNFGGNQVYQESDMTQISNLNNHGAFAVESLKNHALSTVEYALKSVYIKQVSAVPNWINHEFDNSSIRFSMLAQFASPSSIVQRFIRPLKKFVPDSYLPESDKESLNIMEREVHAKYVLGKKDFNTLDCLASEESKINFVESIATTCRVSIISVWKFLRNMQRAKEYAAKTDCVKDFIAKTDINGFVLISRLVEKPITTAMFTKDYEQVLEQSKILIVELDRAFARYQEAMHSYTWQHFWYWLLWYRRQQEIEDVLRKIHNNIELIRSETQWAMHSGDDRWLTKLEKAKNDLKKLQAKSMPCFASKLPTYFLCYLQA